MAPKMLVALAAVRLVLIPGVLLRGQDGSWGGALNNAEKKETPLTCGVSCPNPTYPTFEECDEVKAVLNGTNPTDVLKGLPKEPIARYAVCYSECCNVTSVKKKNLEDQLTDFDVNINLNSSTRSDEQNILHQACGNHELYGKLLKCDAGGSFTDALQTLSKLGDTR